MGAGDSKLSFKKGVFRLAEETGIAANDPYWFQFWELPETAEDVFTLFSATDIRRTRDAHLENLETLILVVISRLFALRRDPLFPDSDRAPERDALNCIRILTRILPFLYEDERLEVWQERFFWGNRRRRASYRPEADVLFDETREAGIEEREERPGEFVDAPPLMEELIDTLIDLLFFSGFTLPATHTNGKNKVTYAIWQSGVGCNTPVGTTKEGESNKIETLRLLLAIMSKAMYMPAHTLPVQGTKALTYMAASSDKKIVLSLLCSLLNTTLKYNPAAWRVPYDHVVFSDPRQVLVTYSLQTLLVLVLYPMPDNGAGPVLKNNYRHYLGRLHRTQDFQFCVDGMTRILEQPIQATTSYLPGSQKQLKWAPEMMMLFWEGLQCNKRFRTFIIDTDRVHDFIILIIYYALEHRLDPSKSGVVRMCVFVLQTLSTEPKFGKCLNKRFEGQASLPASVRIPSFSGTYADYLMISIYTLITTSKGKLGAVYPALLAIVANIAPHVQNLSSAASVKLIQLFTSMSAPGFLLANDSNHTLLHSLLESMNAIIEHQYAANANFIYAILRSYKRFEALRNFTLESGQEEIDRQNRVRKDRGESSTPTSPPPEGISPRASSQQQPAQTPLSPRPDSPALFAIGGDDDDESDSEAASKPPKTPTSPPLSPTTTRSPPPAPHSRAGSITSQAEDAVPLQLRGMSEKARGKLPENAFRRQGSTTSLASHVSTSATPGTTGFAASNAWLESWLPHLPLHTILTVIAHLQPHLQTLMAVPPAPGMRDTSMLEHIRTHPAHGIEASAVKTHMFEWSPLALGWYESLLWGFIFVSELAVSKGTVGVWNGTNVKLFRVEQTAPEGPSLLAPRGGVDAIGTSLVERLGSVTGRMRDAGGTGTGTPTTTEEGPGQGEERRGARESGEGGRTAVV